MSEPPKIVWRVSMLTGGRHEHWDFFDSKDEADAFITQSHHSGDTNIEVHEYELKAMSDPISPAHYKQGPIEAIDAIHAALTAEEFRGFCKGNVLKYVWRTGHKGGTEDLRKAAFYLERLTRKDGE